MSTFKRKPYLRRRAERLSPPCYSRRFLADVHGSQQHDASAAENDIFIESAGGGGASIRNNSLMSTNTTADADDSNSNDPYYNPKGDAYEFTAFALWYLFLVLCCVVPTYCAYRRRARAARLEMEQRERRMLAATRGPDGSDWYVEAMAELERRRREDDAYDAAVTAGVDGVLAGSLMLGANDPGQGGGSSINNSTDVVLFRGMSADGRPITVLAGSGTATTATLLSLNAAADPSSVAGTRMRTSTTSSTDEPMRLVYLRRESSGTDDDARDGIRTFTGLNFGSNVNPFTSVAGASWFMAAAQQREQVQREERTRILDAVLENSSMWVNDGDLLTAEDAEEVSGEGLGTNINDADDPMKSKDSGETRSASQNDGLDNDVSSSTCKVERDEEDAVDKKDEEEGSDAMAEEDGDSEFPFLRLRAPMLGAIKYDPKDPDKINRIMRKHRGRIVPSSCAICLCPYSIDDEVSWSTKGSACPHAFHTSCIKLWLSKKEEALCPCCRQQFVSVEILMKHLPAVEDDYEQDQDQEVE